MIKRISKMTSVFMIMILIAQTILGGGIFTTLSAMEQQKDFNEAINTIDSISAQQAESVCGNSSSVQANIKLGFPLEYTTMPTTRIEIKKDPNYIFTLDSISQKSDKKDTVKYTDNSTEESYIYDVFNITYEETLELEVLGSVEYLGEAQSSEVKSNVSIVDLDQTILNTKESKFKINNPCYVENFDGEMIKVAPLEDDTKNTKNTEINDTSTSENEAEIKSLQPEVGTDPGLSLFNLTTLIINAH